MSEINKINLSDDQHKETLLSENIDAVLAKDDPELLNATFAEIARKLGCQSVAEMVVINTEMIRKLLYMKSDAPKDVIKRYMIRLAESLRSKGM